MHGPNPFCYTTAMVILHWSLRSCHWSFICWRFRFWFNRNQKTFENRCFVSHHFGSHFKLIWTLCLRSSLACLNQLLSSVVPKGLFFELQTAIIWWLNQIPHWEILTGFKLCPQHCFQGSAWWWYTSVFEVLDWKTFQLAPCQQYKLRATRHLMTSFRRARHTFSALWPYSPLSESISLTSGSLLLAYGQLASSHPHQKISWVIPLVFC